MNRLPLIMLAILIFSSGWFGLAHLTESKLKQSASAWEQERSALQKRIWDLQKRNSELENRRTRESAAATAAIAGEAPGDESPRAGDGGSPPSRFPGRNDGGRFASLMNNPEVQKLMAVQQKAALDTRYSSLFKQLQLNPVDLEKFKNLLVEKQTAVMDVMAAARAEGLTGRENRDEIRQLVQQAQAEVDNNIRTTLGDATYAQYQSFESTQPQRAVVSQLEQRLSYSSTPLTDAQSQQLVQILASTAPAGANNANRNPVGAAMMMTFAGGARGTAGGMLASGTPITTDAINQAQSVLSAPQVSALQGLQQEQQASAQLMKQMRANFQTGAPGPTATPASTPPSGK